MPTLLLLPLDFREVVVVAATSMDPACVLGAPLLCGDCASPAVSAGVTATDVSRAGKAPLVCRRGGGGKGSSCRTFSTAAICLPLPKENCLSREICTLMDLMNSLHSGPRSWLINFSAFGLATFSGKRIGDTHASHSCRIGPGSMSE